MDEKMSNQNNNQKAEVKVEQTVEQPQPENGVVQVVVQAPQSEEKSGGFIQWCKKHWKALTGAALGVAGASAATVVAYKKGKAAGIGCVVSPDEDYSVNPNE